MTVTNLEAHAYTLEALRNKKGFICDMDGVIYHGNLLLPGVREFVDFLKRENKKFLFLTNSSERAPKELQQKLERIQKLGEGRTGLMVDVAFNYGGRNEIAHAARCIAQQVKEGKLTPEQITEQTVEQNLYTAGVPDPDLIIRPSGEQRLSNFLIWQSAYSEYVFMDVLWPDFTPEHLEQAIAAFHQRQRRFGGI